jgi:hypothetical protein
MNKELSSSGTGKLIRKWSLWFAMLALVFFLTGCSQQSDNVTENNGPTEVTKPKTIEEQATAVIEALKNKDMLMLSEKVDPNQGLLFSPYAYVDVASDLVFTAAEVQNLFSDSNVYTWGHYDGKGDPIELTFSDYYDRFVYDQDYENADKISNNERLGKSNTIGNLSEVYPHSTTIEYHFEGFNPDYAGMDWKSLRLVFQQTAGTWYLVAIVHDEWTI